MTKKKIIDYEKLIILIVCSFLIGVMFSGCVQTESIDEKVIVNQSITLLPGAFQEYELKERGTYTNIKVVSNIPLNIEWEGKTERNKYNTKYYTIDVKILFPQNVSIINPSSEMATVDIRIVNVKEYKTLI